MPVFQQTTLPMLQLAQQYQGAAEELRRDNQQYGRAQEMPTHAESIAKTLLRGQFTVLMTLSAMPWSQTDPLRSIFKTLYMSSEVATAALQLLVGACEDLQVRYKDMARQQQLLKRKKKQQSCQQVALNPLLLKLTVPADHVNVGVPPGWEDGAVKPLGSADLGTLHISPQAFVCHLSQIIIGNHVSLHVIDNPTTEGVWMKLSRDMGVAK